MKLTKPIHRLKRQAKQLSRENGIPLHEALDQIAEQEGYRSWSLLVSQCDAVTTEEGVKNGSSYQITKLPIDEPDRAEFVKAANCVFERVLERIEARHPDGTRDLWDAGHYVDKLLLREDMLPISRDHALSLVDAFLVHHVVSLATQADQQGENG